MAIKLRSLLSEIATFIKAINNDDRVSFRFLHKTFNSKIDYYLRLESKTREIFRLFHEWAPLEIEFIDVPTNSVGYYDDCNTLKRSKDKIPNYFNSIFGPTFKLFDINGFLEFKRIDRSMLRDEMNKQFKSKIPFYIIENGYIYMPNSTIENATGYTLSKLDNNNSNSDCNLVLESTISYPEYLIELVKKEMKQELSNGYKRMIEDEKPDENSNKKA